MATMAGTMILRRPETANTLSKATASVSAHESVAKNVLLFFAAPFIGLAYVVAFPFIGTAVMVKLAVKALF